MHVLSITGSQDQWGGATSAPTATGPTAEWSGCLSMHQLALHATLLWLLVPER